MKNKVLILVVIFATVWFSACEKTPIDKGESYIQNYYIVGYDACEVNINDETAKARGYVFVSENLKDTLVAYNLPDNLFTFPREIMPDNIMGFNLFPNEHRFAYKVQMTYRKMTDEEKLQIFCVYPSFYPKVYNFEPGYVVIESIFKTQ